MPVDQKRINGPESTVPYNVYINSSKSVIEEVGNSAKARGERRREDDRPNDHPRKMFVKTGITSQAKGSAYIEMGKTKVVCSVFDPREIPNNNSYGIQGSLYCEFKFASFSCEKRRIHQRDSEEKEYSVIMRRALEPSVRRHEFPNFQVDIYALVLDNDGSCLGAAITAASLALADAGIPMYGLVTAVTLGIDSDAMLVDPTVVEETICNSGRAGEKGERVDHGIMMLAALSQHDQIAELYFVGDAERSSIRIAVELATKACKNLCPVLEKCLVKSVMESLKGRNPAGD